MKELSTSRKLYVRRRAPSLFALSPNKFLFTASPHSSFATILRFCQLQPSRCCLLRFAAQLRRTSTPRLPSIQFA
jgi:hypothetical protein